MQFYHFEKDEYEGQSIQMLESTVISLRVRNELTKTFGYGQQDNLLLPRLYQDKGRLEQHQFQHPPRYKFLLQRIPLCALITNGHNQVQIPRHFQKKKK